MVGIEPKVMEPYEPIPGRVPRKVDIERKRIKYGSYKLKDELEKRGIIDKLLKCQSDRTINWMKLETFDDTTFDDYSQSEWLEKAKMNVC